MVVIMMCYLEQTLTSSPGSLHLRCSLSLLHLMQSLDSVRLPQRHVLRWDQAVGWMKDAAAERRVRLI